jgi:hypothetical protein
MPRTNRTYRDKDTAWFDQAVVDAYEGTTKEERQILALAWVSQNFDFYKEFAEDRKLMPAALIVACLDEADHPICTEARTPFAAASRVLLAEIRSGHPLSTAHVDKSEVIHSPCG